MSEVKFAPKMTIEERQDLAIQTLLMRYERCILTHTYDERAWGLLAPALYELYQSYFGLNNNEQTAT